jgi:hypothetical protein
MTRKKDGAKRVDREEGMAGQEDFLRPLIQEVVQQVLEAEMDEALGAGKSERTAGRLGYRSGHYSRTLSTRVGKLELRVPQDRQGRFRTEVFERYQRSETALAGAPAEMCVQGVSMRKVKAITEELCGPEVSAATVIRRPPWSCKPPRWTVSVWPLVRPGSGKGTAPPRRVHREKGGGPGSRSRPVAALRTGCAASTPPAADRRWKRR